MLAVYIILAVLAVLAVILLYMFLPSFKKHPDLERVGEYIAHRGLHNLSEDAPENSIAAFLEAVRYGYAIEIDIHITADGEVVVFHDNDTKRMCGTDGKIEYMTLPQIKKLRLSGGYQQIPTLAECLSAVDGSVPLLIEFKCDNKNYHKLCTAANEILSKYKGIYLVQSFFPLSMGWYKKNRPDVCRGQLSEHFDGKKHKALSFLLGALLFNYISRPHFVSYNHRDADYLPRRLSSSIGAYPIGWTFRKPEDLEKNKSKFKKYSFEGFLPNK